MWKWTQLIPSSLSILKNKQKNRSMAKKSPTKNVTQSPDVVILFSSLTVHCPPLQCQHRSKNIRWTIYSEHTKPPRIILTFGTDVFSWPWYVKNTRAGKTTKTRLGGVDRLVFSGTLLCYSAIKVSIIKQVDRADSSPQQVPVLHSKMFIPI